MDNETLENAVLNVYAKCGDIKGAYALFNSICTRRGTPSITIWNTIINAHAKHRDGREACALFDRLINDGVQPDYITFVVLLNACAHSGLVSECQQYYHNMQHDYSIFNVINSVY